MRKLFITAALVVLTISGAWAGVRTDRLYVGPMSGSTVESGRARVALSTSSTWTAISIRGGAAQSVPFIGIQNNSGAALFTVSSLGAVDSASAHFGPATGWVAVSRDGYISYEGTAYYWDDMNAGASALPGGINAPDLISHNGAPFQGYGFNGSGSPTNGEEIFGTTELSHSFCMGTNLHPHVHWCSTTANTGTVQWNLAFELFTNTTRGQSTVLTYTVSQATNGTAWQEYYSEFTEITTTAISTLPVCFEYRFYRDPTLPGDNYPDDAYLHLFQLHFNICRPGSKFETAP